MSRRRWDALHRHALGFPEAWEDHPWDEVVVKVGKKVFVFLGRPEVSTGGCSVKLTTSHDHAISVGGTPTGYGMGKAGWVSVPLGAAPLDLLRDWVDESYRNVAPARLLRTMTR